MAKNKRERNVDSDDDRAAKIAEKNPLDEEDEHAPENQVVQYGVRGHGDQRRAVVKRNNPDARRQAAVVIDPVNGRLDLRNHVGGFFGAPLHDDCADHVVVRVAAQNAEPRPVADGDLADILHQHRNAVLLAQNDVLDVVNFVALPSGRQLPPSSIRPTPRILMDCWPMRISRPPTLMLAVAERGQNLRHRDAVGFELVRVDFDLEFLGRTSPTVDGRNARDRQQAGARRSSPEPCGDW